MISTASTSAASTVFRLIHRSMAQYLYREAQTRFDVGKAEFERWTLRQAKDAERLGRWIVEQDGHVDRGNYPMDFGSFNFLSMSHLLHYLAQSQHALVGEIESLVAPLAREEGEPANLLRTILEHEKENLETIARLTPAPSTSGQLS